MVTKWIDTTWDKLFPLPSAEELAMRELQEARCALLKAQSDQEFATAMVQYNTDRIARLQLIVKEGL